MELTEDVMVVQTCVKDWHAVDDRFRNGVFHEVFRHGIGEHHAHDAVVARASGGIEPQLVEHGVAEKRIDFCFNEFRK